MIIFYIIFSLVSVSAGIEKIVLGGLFDENVNDLQNIFKCAVDMANQQLVHSGIGLTTFPLEITYGNEFQAKKNLCKLLQTGVAAIFGPSSPSSSTHCMNICDAKEIPYIDVKWDADTEPPVINMHPHPDVVVEVFVDLIRAWDWKGFTIIYESAPWFPRVAELLKMYDAEPYTITVRRLNVGLHSTNYRHVLRRVKQSSETKILIDCSIETLPEVLKQAQQVGLMTDSHQFIITSMDMHTIDLEPYQHSGTNITGIRLVYPENPLMENVTKCIDASKNRNRFTKNSEEESSLTPETMTIQSAFIFDGVLLLAEAFKQLDVDQLRTKRLLCENHTAWENGNSITNFMRNTVVHGLTGEIKFDNQGYRTDFSVDVIELTSSGAVKIGAWNSTGKLNISRKYETPLVFDDGTLKNKTLKVVLALSAPYGMLSEQSYKLSGNDRFEGFCVDLIHELSLMSGFNYEFHLEPDNDYGSYKNGKWTGMIKELHDHEADLAITDLTITSEREGGVDFTMPFMNLGISILFKKPKKLPPSTFSFMSPFSTEVWLYLGGAYLAVSFCFFILGRISPSEWDNPHPSIEEPTELENQFTLNNSLWFTIGALLQQGSEIAPKAPSTRAVASIWWFFTLIMVSSYTANLAAFLTVDTVHKIISGAEDLAKCGTNPDECKVQFGAKKSGSTINFFKEAKQGPFKDMYTYMLAHPKLLTIDNEEGLAWAENNDKNDKDKNYAFLMESSSIEYLIERHCEVTQVGGLLDDKGYGIAMRKNSTYRGELSEAVLKLQEQGKLTELKTRWWKEKKGGGKCTDTVDDNAALALEIANVDGVFLLIGIGATAIACNLIEMLPKKSSGGAETESLGMNNMKGVFYVLLVGSIFASLYGILEWLLTICKRAKEENVPFKEELMEELKFIGKCGGNTKPVRRRKSTPINSRHSTESDQSKDSNRHYREKS